MTISDRWPIGTLVRSKDGRHRVGTVAGYFGPMVNVLVGFSIHSYRYPDRELQTLARPPKIQDLHVGNIVKRREIRAGRIPAGTEGVIKRVDVETTTVNVDWIGHDPATYDRHSLWKLEPIVTFDWSELELQ